MGMWTLHSWLFCSYKSRALHRDEWHWGRGGCSIPATIFGYLHIWVDNSACSQQFSLRGFWLWWLFRAVVSRDYLLLLSLFGQMVHGGAALYCHGGPSDPWSAGSSEEPLGCALWSSGFPYLKVWDMQAMPCFASPCTSETMAGYSQEWGQEFNILFCTSSVWFC